jgi:hypothetical protein
MRRRFVEGAAIVLGTIAFELALVALAVALDWRFGWTHSALRSIPLVIARCDRHRPHWSSCSGC